jgi:Tfp pilus assembly ATPase PilU
VRRRCRRESLFDGTRQAIKLMQDLLRLVVERKARTSSSPGFPPAIKIDGEVRAGLQSEPLSPEHRRS